MKYVPYAKNIKKISVKPLLFETYLAVIRGSVGSKMFREFYAEVNGNRREVLDKGRLSCAFYASSILKIFDLIGSTQITVHRTLDDLVSSGWRRILKPRMGCVVLWGETASPKDKRSRIQVATHKHIGFYLGNNKAISNHLKKKKPRVHPAKYRSVLSYYWHPKLGK